MFAFPKSLFLEGRWKAKNVLIPAPKRGRDLFRFCVVVFASFIVGWQSSAQAQDAEGRYEFHIGEGKLGPALDRIYELTGLPLLYLHDLAKTADVNPVDGLYTVEEALDVLLKGTNYSGGLTTAKVIVISQKNQEPEGNMTGRHLKKTLLAGAAAFLYGTAVQGADVALISEQNDSTCAESERKNDQSQCERDYRKAPDILIVTGSQNADMRRTEDDPQPYVVFSGEEIRRSQASTVNDYLRQRLPMNSTQVADNNGSRSSVNLRGLGDNETLILVDGRRLPRGNTGSADFRQPDINGIPLSAIERIEVLPATAAGIYGGGATGGVINIITRRNYRGLEAAVRYDNTFRTDAPAIRVDLGGGLTIGASTNVITAFSYAESDPLLVGKRNFARRGRELQFANNPSVFFGSTPPVGYTSNIRSVDGSNLVLDGGAPLNSPFTYVPEGYAGPAGDGGAALVANAGMYNLQLPQDLNGAEQSIIDSPTEYSGLLGLRHEFTENFQGFFDLNWIRNESFANRASVPTNTVLAADAPNNPFTTSVRVSFPSPGIIVPARSKSETLRLSGGLIIKLPGQWNAMIEHNRSQNSFSSEATFPVLGDPDGAGPGPSVTTAYSNGLLNVISDVNAFPLNYSPYLLDSPNRFSGPAKTMLNETSARASGPLFDLPGGSVELSLLASYRKERAKESFLDARGQSAAIYFPERSQNVKSYYLETRWPIIGPSNSIPLVYKLDFQGSMRHDAYETMAPSPGNVFLPSTMAPLPMFTYSANEVAATKYTLGLSYAPIADLMFRASYSTGFLPPSINQIVEGAPSTGPATITDPKRGGIPTSVSFTRLPGGNPELLPEESKSWALGAILTPQFASGLRLSVDYIVIDKVNEIVSLNSQGILDNEDFLPGRVLRAPLTPADEALGYTGGSLIQVDQRAINAASARVKAFDFQADYSFSIDGWGDFDIYAVATWQTELLRQTSPVAPLVDFVGYNNFSNNPLAFRGNIGLNWERGNWLVGWNAQYLASYYIYSATDADVTRDSRILSQGSDTVPSQMYHDLFLRYRFSENSALGNTEISAGIQNVFDKSPPILATIDPFGGYSTYGDPRLRRFSLTVRTRF